MSKPLIINLFAGAGAGKSTIAAEVFAALKRRDINCELVREYAKKKVWYGDDSVFKNQAYIFGKQFYEQQLIAEKVDVIITDSPLLLSIFYNRNPVLGEDFNKMVLNIFNSFNNLNVFVLREKKYNPSGRFQTEEEARSDDVIMLDMLKQHDVPYISVPGDANAATTIIELIKDLV